MKKILRTVFGLLAVLLLVVLGLWLFLNYSPQESTAQKTADLEIQATELYAAFSADETAANQQYIGKILQVRGSVGEKLIDENQAPVLILRESDAMAGVMCTLRKDQLARFETLQLGDQLAVKAKCNGMLMDVVLDEGVILD